MVVEPDGRLIRTEQMRQVQNEVYARPTEGRFRVVMIDGAERMNAESGNRLLKVLEEPPSYACFVLLTTNAAGVLPTIVSRCQIVHFSPLPPEEVAAVVQEKAGIGVEEAHLFASLAGGSVGAALAMAAQPGGGPAPGRGPAPPAPPGGDGRRRPAGTGRRLGKGEGPPGGAAGDGALWLRDALLLAREAPERLVVNGTGSRTRSRIAHRYGGEGLMAMLESVAAARGALLRNANTRLVLDVLLLDLHGAAQPGAGWR